MDHPVWPTEFLDSDNNNNKLVNGERLDISIDLGRMNFDNQHANKLVSFI